MRFSFCWQTIDWVLRLEDDFFPVIGGDLGTSKESAAAFVKKLEDFVPTCKVFFVIIDFVP